MTKLTKWEKTELLKIYKNDRRDLRCVKVQELIKIAEELTESYNGKIKNLTEELNKVTSQKNKILDDNRLRDFDNGSSYSCKITTLHKSLIIFDKKTNTEIQKLIKGEI